MFFFWVPEIDTMLVVQKGLLDDTFPLKGGGHVHMKLQFILSEEERNRIRIMVLFLFFFSLFFPLLSIMMAIFTWAYKRFCDYKNPTFKESRV